MKSIVKTIRFPVGDLVKIQKRAAKAGMTLNRYVVLSALGKNIKIYPELKQVALELFKIRTLLEDVKTDESTISIKAEVERLCRCCASLMGEIARSGN